MINEADGWRGRNVWYLGRSVRYALKEVTIASSNAERIEVSRGHSSREVKDRISRSLEYDRERSNEDVYKRQVLQLKMYFICRRKMKIERNDIKKANRKAMPGFLLITLVGACLLYTSRCV